MIEGDMRLQDEAETFMEICVSNLPAMEQA